MAFVKWVLYKLLGVKLYLRVVSNLFFLMYRLGLLKGQTAFDYHYFVKKIIKEGDVVIDLGANLGYYSRIFSDLVGDEGTVYCIEPVALFRTILKKNCKYRENLVILPYAIGVNDDVEIKMGVPVTHGYFSHGRTHVLSGNEKCLMTFNAVVKTPDSLFPGLKKLDYLKCDIEGSESVAIPLFQNILRKFNPVLQIEIAGKNREQLVSFLSGMNYIVGKIRGKKISLFSDSILEPCGDFIFIPKNKLHKYKDLIDNIAIPAEADQKVILSSESLNI